MKSATAVNQPTSNPEPSPRVERMRLVLYQPDIPQNTGTILRLAACFGLPVDVIGPTGFDMSDRALRRAAMDYLAHVEIQRHVSFESFERWRRAAVSPPRLVLLTTAGGVPFTDFNFSGNDMLMLGRESAGVPPEVHAAADTRLVIPMRPGLRSLNIAVAAAMAVGEAMRQCKMYDAFGPAP